MKTQASDMPKLESPFERETQNNKYSLVPKIKDEYRWIFDPDNVVAVDKLDGTNVSVIIEEGTVTAVFNRSNRIPFINKGSSHIIKGLLNAKERGYLELEDGQHFGELIGPKINGNPYKLDEHLWVPFRRMKEKYSFRFWNEFVNEIKDKSDEEKFEEVSKLFKGLWSIYKRQLNKFEGEVDENTGFTGLAAEGIVFYRKDDMIDLYGSCCKLRRDMFEWYSGPEHKKNKSDGGKNE